MCLDLSTIHLKSEISPAPVETMRIDESVLFPIGYAHTMIREDEAARTLRLRAEAGLTVGEPA